MQAAVLAVTMGHGDDDILVNHVLGDFLELADPLVVGAVTPADGHRPLIQPQHVSALHAARRRDAPQGGDAVVLKELLRGQRLFAPQGLAHGEVHRTLPGDLQRIMGIDGVQAAPGILGQVVHIGDVVPDNLLKGIVLLEHLLIVRTAEVAEVLPSFV